MEVETRAPALRTFDHRRIADPGAYLREWLERNPGGKLIVGCDSQFCRGVVTYVTVLAMFYPGNHGAHVLYARDRVRAKMDLFNRIWGEVERSRELAAWAEDATAEPVEIHVDVNPSDRFKSNTVLSSGVGYLTGLGFRVQVKPTAWVASCCADILCK